MLYVFTTQIKVNSAFRARWLTGSKWLASITLCNPREKIEHQEINFRPLFRILINTKFLVSVWYVLKQIFTPLSAKEVNIYLFASRVGIRKHRSYYWIPLRWKLVNCSTRTWSFFLGKNKIKRLSHTERSIFNL